MKAAMVFAAGLGTRLRPLTNSLPKALVPYKGKPLIDWVLERLYFFGFRYVVVNVHHFADKLEYHLRSRDYGMEIVISDERAELLETGGGLYFAKRYLDSFDKVLLHNVDILTDLDLGKFYESIDEESLAVLAVQRRDSDRVLLFDDKGLCGWRNNRSGEQQLARQCVNYQEFAFSGIHVVRSKIFELLKPGKYSIIKFYLEVANAFRISYFDHTGDFWRDMGRPSAFED